jgi:hypothetical protein
MLKLPVLALLYAGSLFSTTITFDEAGFPAGPFASTTFAGVTFSAAGGGGAIITSPDPNGTLGLLDMNSPHKELVALIAGGATFVSVDLGDFDQDADLVFLQAFDAANNSLAFTSLLIPATFTGLETLSITAVGIDHVQFGARDPAGDGNSVYADNFTFTASSVPEPSSLLSGSFAVGLTVFGFRRRSQP